MIYSLSFDFCTTFAFALWFALTFQWSTFLKSLVLLFSVTYWMFQGVEDFCVVAGEGLILHKCLGLHCRYNTLMLQSFCLLQQSAQYDVVLGRVSGGQWISACQYYFTVCMRLWEHWMEIYCKSERFSFPTALGVEWWWQVIYSRFKFDGQVDGPVQSLGHSASQKVVWWNTGGVNWEQGDTSCKLRLL